MRLVLWTNDRDQCCSSMLAIPVLTLLLSSLLIFTIAEANYSTQKTAINSDDTSEAENDQYFPIEPYSSERAVILKRSIHRSPSIVCSIKRYRNRYYSDQLIERKENVTESKCVYSCWRRKNLETNKCIGVNYFPNESKCELVKETEDEIEPKPSMDCTFIIPISCGDDSIQPDPSSTITSRSLTTRALNRRKPSGRAGTARGSCGRSNSRSQKIVGGSVVTPHSFPWVVSLQMRGRHFCGGTLVRVNSEDRSDIVVTAAHCLQKSARNVRVVVGLHSLRDSSGQSVPVKKVYIHRSYSTQSNVNDIAIVVLSSPVRFGPAVQPVCLPVQGQHVPDGSYLYAVGWGDTSEGGSSSSVLREVAVPVISTSQCSSNYGGSVRIYPNEMLCAGAWGKDSCQGDSGGPLLKKSAGGYVLEGVVSFGIGCGRLRKPGVYSRLANYVGWINQQIRSLSSLHA